MNTETVHKMWDQYWPIVYDYLAQPPPILWIMLGLAVFALLLPYRRGAMDRAEEVRKMVSDEALQMLENLADTGRITWAEAEREMIRMGRNYGWGDLIPRRTKEYHLTGNDIKELKGRILARREDRQANGEDKPVELPDVPKRKKLTSGGIGRLIHRRANTPEHTL